MSDDLVPKDRDVPEPITKGLAGQQLQAIALLVQGTRPGVVARKIGIDRATLWRWRQLPQFRGHLERLRYELHTARVDRIWSLVDKAYDVVEEHLDEGDSQVALRLLGLAGGGGSQILAGRVRGPRTRGPLLPEPEPGVVALPLEPDDDVVPTAENVALRCASLPEGVTESQESVPAGRSRSPSPPRSGFLHAGRAHRGRG
jgi:hypothetical protein